MSLSLLLSGPATSVQVNEERNTPNDSKVHKTTQLNTYTTRRCARDQVEVEVELVSISWKLEINAKQLQFVCINWKFTFEFYFLSNRICEPIPFGQMSFPCLHFQVPRLLHLVNTSCCSSMKSHRLAGTPWTDSTSGQVSLRPEQRQRLPIYGLLLYLLGSVAT